ncbi:MAG: hypothetical protein JXA53_04840 [Bacteroidales bacterium]|nr:hypothetical protein [Bacteroidales bacterium]
MRKLCLFFILLFVVFSSVVSAWGQTDYEIDAYHGQTILDPNGYFYDSGGNSMNYSNREGYWMIFQASPDKVLSITFETFSVRSNDNLYVYDSGDWSNQNITYSSANSPQIGIPYVVSNPDNALGFYFVSDNRNVRPGWRAKVETIIINKNHFYSYQSGNWDTNTTWTLDPSGTVFVDGGVPGAGDQVTILNGRDVSVTTSNKDITAVEIEKGGSLDLTLTTGHTFGDIAGQGLLRLATTDFPTITSDAFLQAGGGTVEYYFSGNRTLETSVTQYNNLVVNLAFNTNRAAIANNLTISGDLTINRGSFRIDAGDRNTISIDLQNNLLINNNGIFEIADRIGRNTHSLSIKGDFVNNGQALFFGVNTTDYTGTSWVDRCDVTFNNQIKDQSVQMNGLTRFYRIVIDKGVDDTYILNLDASASGNFELLGQNNYNFNSTPGPGNFANNNSLGLLAGTVRIGTNVSIPCLSSASSGTYWIDSDASLWVDGGTVVSSLSSYNLQAVVVYGKIKLSSNGFFTDISSQGVVMRETSILQIDNGVFDANIIRTSSWTNSVHRGTFIMYGGNLVLHGNNTIGDHATFSLPYPDNVFIMSGGNITIENPTSVFGAARGFSLMLNPDLGNSSITGGTVNVIVPTTRDAVINTNMKLWNLNITGSNTRSLVLNSYAGNASPPIPAQPAQDLVVQSNLTVSTTTLNANNQNVTVG